MNAIDTTPLGEFRKKARLSTYCALAIAVIFALIAGGLSASAQSSLSSYSYYDYDDDDDYYDDLYSSSYADQYQKDAGGASLCFDIAVIAGSITGASALAWIGATLLIANKQTSLASGIAHMPMELADCADSAEAPIGSMLSFQSIGDVIVAKDIEGKSVGALNAEFSNRLRSVVAVDNAHAIIESYHGERPVIRLTL